MEASYIRHRIRSEVSRRVYIVFALMALYLFLCDVCIARVESDGDRLRLLSIGVVLGAHLAYLLYIGTAHGRNIYVVSITYTIVAWIAALAIQPRSAPFDKAAAPAGNVVALYFNHLAVASTLSLEVTLLGRTLWLIGNSLQFVAAVAIRRAWQQDDVLIWDALVPTFFIAYLFISVLADYLSRREFVLLTLNRRAHQSMFADARQSTVALGMVLPPFVLERLLRATRKGQLLQSQSSVTQLQADDQAAREYALASSSSGGHNAADVYDDRITAEDVTQASLLRQARLVWPYVRALVMFVSFEPSSHDFETINDTVIRIESVARTRFIQKVKSVGTQVVLIAGVHGTLAFEDAVGNAIEAALEIQRRVFPVNITEGWEHRISLHCGPLYGAVVGNHHVGFDVYGDTVNTASALLRSAPANAIRCTDAVRQAVLQSPDAQEWDFSLEGMRVPVNVKGKGSMQVFHIRAREMHRMGAVIARPSRAAAAPTANDRSNLSLSSDDDEKADPQAIAASIRSSIQALSMLPSAACDIGNTGRAGHVTSNRSGGGAPAARLAALPIMPGCGPLSDTASVASCHSVGLRRPRTADRQYIRQHGAQGMDGSRSSTGSVLSIPPLSATACPLAIDAHDDGSSSSRVPSAGSAMSPAAPPTTASSTAAMSPSSSRVPDAAGAVSSGAASSSPEKSSSSSAADPFHVYDDDIGGFSSSESLPRPSSASRNGKRTEDNKQHHHQAAGPATAEPSPTSVDDYNATKRRG
jgi:class 3 adenylate cyclase